MKPFENKDIYNNVNYKDRFPMIDNIMVYGLVWAVGNSLKENSRKIFD